MKEKYIILRTNQIKPDPYSGTMNHGSTGPKTFEEPSLEVDELDDWAARKLQENPEIKALAPSMALALVEPEDEQVDDSSSGTTSMAWGVKATGADKSDFTGAGIRVAVLDTGIYASHAAFSDVDITFKDFSDDKNVAVRDENGHGTHCAGTIFGRTVNGRRIGIAPGIREVLIGKVLGKGNSGTTEMFFAALEWATNKGAQIISMSLTIDSNGYVECLETLNGLPKTAALAKALDSYRKSLLLFDCLAAYLRTKETRTRPLLIAASGNDRDRSADPSYQIAADPPASTADTVSVGSLFRGDNNLLQVAGSSNSDVDVSAPGVKILSADSDSADGLGLKSGTSIAVPHVAGIAALWAEQLQKEEAGFDCKTFRDAVIGSASTKALEKGFDWIDIGGGLVRAP